VNDPRLRVNVFGLAFPNPVGLAAGFDKNAHLLNFLPSLGFGHVEVGGTTPLPQSGNPKPRLFRLPADRALINRMGFDNDGAGEVTLRLARRPQNCIVGVNIAKNKNTVQDEAWMDYARTFSAVCEVVDYVVINVSSPNTPGLRDLQEKKQLSKILENVQALNSRLPAPKPILLKIAPDLADKELDEIVNVCKKYKVSGIIATNTTVSRNSLLKTDVERVRAIGEGGLSGAPLKNRSTEVIRTLYKKSGGSLPIIGVGGILSAQDAYEKIKSGASLVQVYTGLIYEGPSLAKKINKGLLKFLRRDGFSSIQEAVGKG
jgi:dihydroorotate dehydrogenase